MHGLWWSHYRFFTWMLHLILPDDIHIFSRVFMLVLGCVILAYGMTIVIKSDAGTGPNDLVAVVISDKIGFILGGTVGAGTIV